ncbi:MAG TPA: hypothetical protein VGA78_13340, partial [Gemmatimonadales bacterium]
KHPTIELKGRGSGYRDARSPAQTAGLLQQIEPASAGWIRTPFGGRPRGSPEECQRQSAGGCVNAG